MGHLFYSRILHRLIFIESDSLDDNIYLDFHANYLSSYRPIGNDLETSLCF